MKVRKPLLMLAAVAVWLPLRAAHAGFQYQSTLVEDDSNTSNVHLPGCALPNVLSCKPSNKVIIKQSKKKGDGGLTIQLVLKKVTCGGSACNAQNHVMQLDVRTLGMDVPSQSNPAIVGGAGILFNYSNGTAVFPSTGKNKIGAGGVFGFLSNAIFQHSLGIGLIKIHDAATAPSDCANPPLLQGNHCTDGAIYAVAGLPVPIDPQFLCASDSDCPTITQVCQNQLCVTEPCASDSDCRSGSCNINAGTCCDPTQGNCG